jgi:hypothetical protein
MTDKTEMTEARAREILHESELIDNNGNFLLKIYPSTSNEKSMIVLSDHNWYLEELEAIAWWMRNKI